MVLPEWGIAHVKAKIDTGARTSALHAFDIEIFEREGDSWARFALHPWQRSGEDSVVVEAAVLDHRHIRSSSGAAHLRPVVETTIVLAGEARTVEMTLTRRDEMGFRMLIGRQALTPRYVVDPGKSYLGGRPTKSIRSRNHGRS